MSLRNNTKLEKYISELNGYLAAVSHYNDQVGYRLGFFADLIEIDNKEFKAVINEYLKVDNAELKEISSREERKIIEFYTFHNYMLDDYKTNKKTLSFVKEQIRWHIQDYFTIAEQYSPELGKFEYSQKQENAETTYIFTIYKDKMAIMCFHFRHENVST